MQDSPFFIAAGINENPEAQREMRALFSESLKNNYISTIARDIKTDKVVGVAVNELEKKRVSSDEPYSEFDQMKDDILKTRNSRKLLNVWRYISSKNDFFEEFGVKSLVNSLYFTIIPEYRNTKVATFLYQNSRDMLNNLKDAEDVPKEIRDEPPEILVYLLVSPYTQKMLVNKKGTAVLREFSNKNFVFDGKSFADRMGLPESCSILCAERLKPYKGPWNY
jgi:hypothetical protein